MGQQRTSLFEKLLSRRVRAFWSRAANAAGTTDLSLLRDQRNEARILRQKLDELTYIADSRLALPRIGSSTFPKPAGTDWSWRPQLWRGALPVKGMSSVDSKTMLGDEVTIFHDCQISELTLRQLRNTREADLAPFGLRMDVFRFDGSFLSLVLNLPQASCEGLLRRHLLRMDAIVEVEKPLEIFARLNVRHGPNTEQIVRELPMDGDKVMVEFDLAYTKLNEKRVEAMWIDLIFEGPEMNQVTIRDVTFSRHPRAEL
ncbi:DUF6478 family protein [Octadecabacter ascidiaceicola]|uniref:Uncharacterized protein n=1 Tax=Octadecabacter ascidiaceicola TaxID=1655543 RepID=A0A238KAV4_9RHOB|nr:DUF6478 family protein [Octadecabacter ascidiaceicola]SMX40000.1 hypothetical protein OCA8868_02222 [Octadecabacter ascidiaceicola]